MGHTGPSLVVRAPRAEAPYNGLLLAAAKPDPNDEADLHWQNGIRYEPEGCVIGQLYDPCETGESVNYPTKQATVDWVPYAHIVTEKCSTFSLRDERVERVTRLLNYDRERAIGREFWRGDLAQDSDSLVATPTGTGAWPNTWLSNVADVVTLGTVGMDPINAFSCLEGYLDTHNGGQQGMIHTTAGVVAEWDKANMLYRRDDGTIVTINGTLVVNSAGYDGTSPLGVKSSGNIWAYATDMVRVWKSPPQIFDLEHTIDRQNNTVQVQAQEIILAEWQKCRHAGVSINLPVCETGS